LSRALTVIAKMQMKCGIVYLVASVALLVVEARQLTLLRQLESADFTGTFPEGMSTADCPKDLNVNFRLGQVLELAADAAAGQDWRYTEEDLRNKLGQKKFEITKTDNVLHTDNDRFTIKCVAHGDNPMNIRFIKYNKKNSKQHFVTCPYSMFCQK